MLQSGRTFCYKRPNLIEFLKRDAVIRCHNVVQPTESNPRFFVNLLRIHGESLTTVEIKVFESDCDEIVITENTITSWKEIKRTLDAQCDEWRNRLPGSTGFDHPWIQLSKVVVTEQSSIEEECRPLEMFECPHLIYWFQFTCARLTRHVFEIEAAKCSQQKRGNARRRHGLNSVCAEFREFVGNF